MSAHFRVHNGTKRARKGEPGAVGRTACATFPNLLTLNYQRAVLKSPQNGPQRSGQGACVPGTDLRAPEGQRVDRQSAGTIEDHIASVLRFRRARAELFGETLFVNPAWDILLQLFAAKLSDRQIRLADLAVSAPGSTLARWASALEEQGLISCHLDGLNAENLRIELSSAGAAKMASLFRSARDLAPID